MVRFLATVAALSLVAAAPVAASVVIDFDDLPADGVVPTGYMGVNWGGGFNYYDDVQSPFSARSGATRIYGNYNLYPAGFTGQMPILLGAGSVFDGAWFAGYDFNSITLSLYSGGVLQTSVTSGALSGTPQFLATNWTGGIDEIRVTANGGGNGYWVGDDSTFDKLVDYQGGGAGAVPEPATWAMLITGFGLVGAAARRRRVGSVLA